MVIKPIFEVKSVAVGVPLAAAVWAAAWPAAMRANAPTTAPRTLVKFRMSAPLLNGIGRVGRKPSRQRVNTGHGPGQGPPPPTNNPLKGWPAAPSGTIRGRRAGARSSRKDTYFQWERTRHDRFNRMGRGSSMFETVTSADQVLAGPLAVAQEPDALLRALEEIPAPIYVTDALGLVTYFNQSCVGFAGRNPQTGKDRWCVTWKLFTEDGKFLPHDQCPMAVSIGRREKVRGLTALAERPDGTRVRFMPFPTPIFSETGEFQGAINMLIDITENQQAADLRLSL